MSRSLVRWRCGLDYPAIYSGSTQSSTSRVSNPLFARPPVLSHPPPLFWSRAPRCIGSRNCWPPALGEGVFSTWSIGRDTARRREAGSRLGTFWTARSSRTSFALASLLPQERQVTLLGEGYCHEPGLILVSFSFLFLALPLRLSCSRSQSALALIGTAPVSFWRWFVPLFLPVCFLTTLLDYYVLQPFCQLSFSSNCCYFVFCQEQSCLVGSSPVECLTLSLPSLPVVGGQWSVCLRAQPSGLYSPLWKLLLATLAGTAHPLAHVKSATVFQFFLFCVCLVWLANNRLPEFVWILNSLFWLAFASGSLCDTWHNGSVKNTFFTLSKSALFSRSHYSPCCFKC